LDTTVDEVSSVFSKCGMIAEELESGLPRIKLYQDDSGKLKGDALIVYFRPESVQLAIQMLDDTDFRFGTEGPMGKMRVKEADFSYKRQKEAPTSQNAKDKQKFIRKAQKMTR
jgi:HIV Tat-specific factor 1